MSTQNKIDYSLFKCEVYNPDGSFLKDARFNAYHYFYCENLVPDSLYFLVFSYDDILIECMQFRCQQAGKVAYLYPLHVVFNNEVSNLPPRLLEALRTKIENRLKYDVPVMPWAKQTMQNYFAENPNYMCNKYTTSKILCYGAGLDITQKVK